MKGCPQKAAALLTHGVVLSVECDKSGKGIPFFEFRWSYYMNDAFNNGDLWGGDDDYTSFVKAYKDVDVDKLGKIKTSTWEEAAERLIPLCRWDGTGSYEVKLGGALEGSLPGVVEGWNPIAGDDPECDSPACTPTNQQTFKHASKELNQQTAEKTSSTTSKTQQQE